jgi:hypothetical protein
LLGSPLLGPAVWRSTGAALQRMGWVVQVAAAAPRAPQGPGEVLEHLLAQLAIDEPVALVAHSNAGLYVPALMARRPVVASILADAALPPPSGDAAIAPPAMQEMLLRMADANGLLPPWTHWWPEQEVASLFPDVGTRAAVEAEQPRLPVGYFSSSVPVPDDWATHPAAYLAFSDAYLPQQQEASRWGWPVRMLPGGHLHPLVAPEAVASTIGELLRQLLPDREPGVAPQHV